MNQKSRWIWPDSPAGKDQYAEFYQPFVFKGESLLLRISADSDYAVYVNGKWVTAGQYPDYPCYKVYDQIDLTPFCALGENHLAVMVWHYGLSNMSYIPQKAAVRFELTEDERMICCSDTTVLSRLSRTFHNGYCKTITGQLGLSYWYDMTMEDGWMTGELDGFAQSVLADIDPPMYQRPIPKYKAGTFCAASSVWEKEQKHFLFDLGRESVGYLQFVIHSSAKQKMLVAWGEHIADGGVRRLVGGRDFSVEYTLKQGRNENMNPFRRFGLRYLEIFCEQPVEIEFIGIRPTDYPVTVLPKSFDEPLRQRIYDVCVRTLQLCMHDHYEDTPWREQALYAMDSRNQMLCGYYAFGEYAFPRANLLLMSKCEREDGLLSICFPNKDALTIPSFSLHYFTSVWEYTTHSGDMTLLTEIYPKLERLMQAFTDCIEDGLLPNWTDKYHWNFYEWSEGLCGQLLKETPPCIDAALNCLFSIALQRMNELSKLMNFPGNYYKLAQQVNEGIRKRFFSAEECAVYNSTLDGNKSVLVNALAILCGAVQGAEAQAIAAKLADAQSSWTPATLSMLCFRYDALLKVDAAKYRAFILDDIDQKYAKMLDAGATSFWETELGESDFEDAGSLCHAWSSMPVYYYHLLNT